MDQSDNVDTTYLLIGGKKLAQNTDANAAASKNNSTVLSNGSDNALVNDFIAPAMGCSGFTAPSITSPGGVSGGLALNELRGQAFPGAAPALVPLNDDFTVINNNGAVTQSLTKTNLYRAGVGQPQAADTANASGTTYCQQYVSLPFPLPSCREPTALSYSKSDTYRIAQADTLIVNYQRSD